MLHYKKSPSKTTPARIRGGKKARVPALVLALFMALSLLGGSLLTAYAEGVDDQPPAGSEPQSEISSGSESTAGEEQSGGSEANPTESAGEEGGENGGPSSGEETASDETGESPSGPEEIVFVYDPQPDGPVEITDEMLQSGLPRWEHPIDEAWVPEGWLQRQRTDAASLAEYYTLVQKLAYAPQPEGPVEITDEMLQSGLPKWEFAIDASWVPEGWVLEKFTDEETGMEYFMLVMAPVLLRAPRGVPAYDSGTQVWTVLSGTDLHYAVNNAQSGDIFEIMNDLYMGESSYGLHPLQTPDEIASELFIDKPGITLTFRSGTGGKVSIFRVDHRRHLYIGQSPGSPLSNVTLTFSNVVLDGQQSYDPYAARTNVLSHSSRGGVAVYYTENLIINGLEVRNCFSEVQNVNSGPDRADNLIALGRDEHSNGGAMNIWYGANTVLNDCVFENNVAGSVGGALCYTQSSGALYNCTLNGNASRRPSDSGRGGAILLANPTGDFLISGCTITNNTAEGLSLQSFSGAAWPTTNTMPDYGGAIYAVANQNLTIHDTILSGNTANFGGAVVYSSSPQNQRELKITGTSQFVNNTALNNHQAVENNVYNYNKAYGGAIYAETSKISVAGTVTFRGNTAQTSVHMANPTHGSPYGGALSLVGCTATLSGNVTFAENHARALATVPSYGGAVFLNAVSDGSTIYDCVFTAGANTVFEKNSANAGGAVYTGTAQSRGGQTDFTNCTFRNNTAVYSNTGYASTGNGGAIYCSDYAALYCTATTFSGNTAQRGAYYLSPGDTSYNAYVANYASRITGTVSLSLPFDVNEGEYAYNNHDITYVGQTPLARITVEYYRDSVDAGNLIDAEDAGQGGRRAIPANAIAAALGNDWINLHRPGGARNGQLQGSLPAQLGTTDLVVQVVYDNTPSFTLTVEYYLDSVSGAPYRTESKTDLNGEAATAVLNSWLGANWPDLHRPAGYGAGVLQNSLPGSITADATLRVLYTGNSTVTVEYYKNDLSAGNLLATEYKTGVAGGSDLYALMVNWLGGHWVHLHQPAGYQAGRVESGLDPTVSPNTVIRVLYLESAASAPSSSTPASSAPASTRPPASSDANPGSAPSSLAPDSSSAPPAGSSPSPGSAPPESRPISQSGDDTLTRPGANLVPGFGKAPHWALVNLLAVILGAGVCLLAFLLPPLRRGKKKAPAGAEGAEQSEASNKPHSRAGLVLWQLLGIVASVASVVLFLLTENMAQPMRFADSWTPVMLVLLAVQAAACLLALHNARRASDDEAANEA